MITPMVKVTFMGPKRHLMSVLDLLHSLGAVHLEPYSLSTERPDFFQIPVDESVRLDLVKNLNSLLEEVNRLLLALKSPSYLSTAPAWLFNHNISREDLERTVHLSGEQITQPYSSLMELKNEMNLLQRYERVLAALYPLLEDAVELQQLELMGIILEKKRSAVLPLLEKELGRITNGHFKIFTRAMDRYSVAAILAYPPEDEKLIRILFSEENIAEIRLPAGYEGKPLATTLRLLIKRQRELPAKIGELDRALEELSERWYGTLTRIRSILRERVDEFTTLTMSAQSRHTFFLGGWIPEEKVPLMFETINSNLETSVHVEVSPARFHEADQVPVQLRNRPLARVFEPLVGMIALPRYGTLDPTPFLAIFFPLFFGFILGDIAYGLILLGLSTWFRRKYRNNRLAKDFCTVFMVSGISATVFGFLFGEFLGDLGKHWGLHPVLMDRAELFLPLLFIAIAFGFAHIMLGFLLSVVISIRNGHRKHWMASLASMLTLGGLALVIISSTGRFPGTDILGAWIMVPGILLLIITEGFMGPLEFLKSFGNVLSYARLMAIGVSSVVLAHVANTIGGILESLAVGLVVALIFHALNFVLGVFSPTIHSLRLHYVEFFSKFFQPGGKPYEPFKRHSFLTATRQQ